MGRGGLALRTFLSRRLIDYRRKRQPGFVLVAFSLALLLLLGSVGLTFDIGRMYITRSESQTFCDAAALAAAQKLDGTLAGITAAKNAAYAIPKRYQFGTTPFQPEQITVSFAKAGGTGWTTAPTSGAGYIYARVQTSVPINMFLMPVLTGKFTASIGALATAQQVAVNNAMNQIFPFAPMFVPPGGSTLPPNGDPYGMAPARQPDGSLAQGGIYTLRGASTTKDLSDMCSGDRTEIAMKFRQGLDQSDRGYIWKTKSTSDIRQQVLGNSIPDGKTVSVGDVIMEGQPNANCSLYPCLDPGNRQTIVDAIQTRAGDGKKGAVTGDTDSASPNYMTYAQNKQGNGDRVVVVPIISGPCGSSYAGAPACPSYPLEPYAPPNLAGSTAAPYSVLGFAGFFLLRPSDYDATKGNDPICAEYIGPWVPNSAGGSPFPGGYKLLLVQ